MHDMPALHRDWAPHSIESEASDNLDDMRKLLSAQVGISVCESMYVFLLGQRAVGYSRWLSHLDSWKCGVADARGVRAQRASVQEHLSYLLKCDVPCTDLYRYLLHDHHSGGDLQAGGAGGP